MSKPYRSQDGDGNEGLTAKYQSLLAVSESIAAHYDLHELFHDLKQRLRYVLQFDYLSLRLHDPQRNLMRRHILERSSITETGDSDELPVNELLSGWVWENQELIVIGNIEQESRFPRAMQILSENGVRSCCCLPLRTAHRCLGALTLGSVREQAYGELDLEFMHQVAGHVALAVDNALNFEQAQSIQRQLKDERDRLSLLLEVNNTVVSVLDLHELLNAVSASLKRITRHEYASLCLYDAETNSLRIQALDFPLSKGLLQEGLSVPIQDAPSGKAIVSRQPVFLTRQDIVEQFRSDFARRVVAEGLTSACCLPLISHGKALGTLVVGALDDESFPRQDAELLQHIANQVAIAVENAMAFGRVSEKANKLAEEKLYLQDEIRSEHNFEEIIGESSALKHVLQKLQTVASTDSTVLILGETGTGKELIARAIHNLSARRERTLVKVNCAAIPTGLLESELFGHERGAFTGAIAQRVGRFELAHRGTLFLDEVGDIPLDLQAKLLRVLQEQEFERLGSTRTIRVDVRLVAATNTDLLNKVADKQFREDLYYRLNVFPIAIPPLRERQEDIPLLVRHFAQKYAARMKRRIDTIPVNVLEALRRYEWPGNIRELENFIERAVILSHGAELQIPIAELKQAKKFSPTTVDPLTTLEEAERQHILRALSECKWVVGGPTGAAAKLGMKRTTLQGRIKKLGIARPGATFT
jgi:formate hydrogenlyase transcriptional activator